MKNMRVFLPSGRIWNLPGARAVGPGWSYVLAWLRGIRRYVLHKVRHELWKSTRIRDRSGREMLHQQGYHPSVLLRARFGRSLMARSSTALIRKRKWMIFLTIVPCIRHLLVSLGNQLMLIALIRRSKAPRWVGNKTRPYWGRSALPHLLLVLR